MRKFARFGVIAAALTVFFGAASVYEANAQDVLRQILNRMDSHNKSLSSLKASVTMAKHNSQLGGDPDVTKGTAFYLPRKGRDAYVRIDWVKPDESLAVKDGKYVIYRPRLGQAITGAVNKSQAKGANNALAFINMSKEQLKANYKVRYLGEETVSTGSKTWRLELTPKTAAGYKVAELWVDGDGMPVQAKVVDNNNDTTTVLLSDVQKNVSLNASLFKISLPKGTKIVKS